jgi:hypothetical protein
LQIFLEEVIMKKLLLLSVAMLLLQSNILSQAPDTLWTKTFGRGNSPDVGNSVQQTSDGGYIVAGSTRLSGGIDEDVYLIKADSSGDTLWTRTFGGIDWDIGNSVQQTSDGGYIIAGWSGNPLFDHGVYLIKTDSSGDTLWTKTFGGYNQSEGNSVQQTSDGGYIVTGFLFSTSGQNVYLIKTDSSGDTLWTKTYGGIYEDGGNSVQQTSDGGYIVAGFTRSFGTSGQNVYLIKTNSLGDTLWTKIYGGSDCWDRGNSVQQTSDGGYIVAGSKSPLYSDNSDIYIIKTNSSGDTLWTKTFGGIDHEEGHSVRQTNDGGYIVAGISWDSNFNSDVYLLKTDSLANTIWTKTFGGIRYYMRYSIQQTSGGGYIVAGSKTSLGAGDSDVWLIKLAPESPTAIRSYDNQIPSNYSISQNYPNPFNPSTTIKYSVPKVSFVTIKIYDVLGSEVATLLNEEKPVGTYELSWSAANLSSGVYFYQLKAGSFVETKKMILLR